MTHSTSPVAWGVDGCKAGWFWFRLPISPAGEIAWGVVKKLQSLFDEGEVEEKVGEHDLILVDIPIGLPTEGTKESDFRKCDKEARERLGARKSSVFPVPRREVVDDLLKTLTVGQTDEALGEKAWKWKNARRVLDRREPPVKKGEGRMTAQSFAILSKIVEVDELCVQHSTSEQIVRETHPEVCFWALNPKGKEPMEFAKKHGLGFGERIKTLNRCFEGAEDVIEEACRRCFRHRKAHEADPRCANCTAIRRVGGDDVADAMVCAVTAWIILKDEDAAKALPARENVTDGPKPPELVYAVPPASAPNGSGSGSRQ